MISLSKEWAALSKAMYGQEFIEELAEFLKKENVKTILECGCGDGNILYGLVIKGFQCLGIDSNKEMITMALEYNPHKNIQYKLMSWDDLGKINATFDAVICRGNSLSVIDWGDGKKLEPEKARQSIIKSIELMLKKIKCEGLFYLDTTSQEEIDKGNHEIKINFPNISLEGKITYDSKNKIRQTYGNGIVNGEQFEGESVSYLIAPKEIEEIIQSFNPQKIWYPNIKHEINYCVICAKK